MTIDSLKEIKNLLSDSNFVDKATDNELARLQDMVESMSNQKKDY